MARLNRNKNKTSHVKNKINWTLLLSALNLISTLGLIYVIVGK